MLGASAECVDASVGGGRGASALPEMEKAKGSPSSELIFKSKRWWKMGQSCAVAWAKRAGAEQGGWGS